MKGFFTLKGSAEGDLKINFEGVAFGGNYGGHNVNVSLSDEDKKVIIKEKNSSDAEVEDLISEVQRKMLNNELIVEYENIKPEEHSDGLAGI